MIDITAMTFGNLRVLERVENNKDMRAQWLCKCDCGKKLVVLGKNLRSGHTKSCGCLRGLVGSIQFLRYNDCLQRMIKKYGLEY